MSNGVILLVSLSSSISRALTAFVSLVDTYTEVIPVTAPPSYRGQMVKYSYKITVGTQRINEPTKLLKIPIRVLNLNINQKEERAPLLSPFATDSKSDATSWALHELLASASLRNTSE